MAKAFICIYLSIVIKNCIFSAVKFENYHDKAIELRFILCAVIFVLGHCLKLRAIANIVKFKQLTEAKRAHQNTTDCDRAKYRYTDKKIPDLTGKPKNYQNEQKKTALITIAISYVF